MQEEKSIYKNFNKLTFQFIPLTPGIVRWCECGTRYCRPTLSQLAWFEYSIFTFRVMA